MRAQRAKSAESEQPRGRAVPGLLSLMRHRHPGLRPREGRPASRSTNCAALAIATSRPPRVPLPGDGFRSSRLSPACGDRSALTQGGHNATTSSDPQSGSDNTVLNR